MLGTSASFKPGPQSPPLRVRYIPEVLLCMRQYLRVRHVQDTECAPQPREQYAMPKAILLYWYL